MPLGPTHRRATLLLLPPAAATTFYVAGHSDKNPLLAAAACATGVVASLVMNPDLDLLENSIKSKMLRLTPPRGLERQLLAKVLWYLTIPVRWLWWLSWYPYSRAISHRSWVSHAPLVGTGIRLLYWCAVVAAAAMLASWLLGLPLKPPGALPGYGWLAVPAAGGLAASDALHWLMDEVM